MLPRLQGEKAMVEAECTICGGVHIRSATSLRRGRSKSCCGGRRDLHGHRSGDLVVLSRAPNRPATGGHPSGHTAWRCRCDACGREVVVSTYQLIWTTHPRTDCGCRRLLPAAPPQPRAAIDTTVVGKLANETGDEVPLKQTSSQQALDAFTDTLRPFTVSAGSRQRHGADDGSGRAVTLDDLDAHGLESD
jgi:hypothetical protein